MKSITLITVAALAVAAWASPATDGGAHPTHNVCNDDVVSQVVNYLENDAVQADASTYCTSVLGGAGAPATVTKTSTSVVKHTVQGTTVKSTATVTKTASGGSSTVTVTVYSNCAIEGYAKTAAYHADTTAGVDNFVTCSAECQADTGCVSFAFGSGQCLLFNVSSVNNVNVAATSPFAFFDRNCPISSASTPPAVKARQIVIPGIISIGVPGHTYPSPTPTISISDPTIASEACSCFLTDGVGAGPTQTVTTVKTVTSDVGGAVVTQATTVTVTVTASASSYATVTVTTTA